MKKQAKKLTEVCHYAYFSSEVMLPDAQRVMNEMNAVSVVSVVMLKVPHDLRQRVNKLSLLEGCTYSVLPTTEEGFVAYYYSIPSFCQPSDFVRQLKNVLQVNNLLSSCPFTWVVDVEKMEKKKGGCNE